MNIIRRFKKKSKNYTDDDMRRIAKSFGIDNYNDSPPSCPPCPVCGRNPYTGTKPVFPITDGESIFIVCGHCSTHYDYKK